MQQCPKCGYMKVGYDGECERCEALVKREPAAKKPHYRNKTLNDLREAESASKAVTYNLPPDEPRSAVSHDDYVEFLRRMQTSPMTEGEVVDLIIRRLERVASGDTPPEEKVYEIKELRTLSDAWLTEAQENRIRSLVIRYAERWESVV